MGADYIEPDLVSTKDHQLVVRHEPAIGATTDVADHPEFADRRTTKVIDGITFANDWFTEDFTLAELKTLRAKERLPDVRQRNTIYDGRYEIPTFQEVIDLRDKLSRELHRQVGLIPELKHSTYFRSDGLPLEEPFVRTLRAQPHRQPRAARSRCSRSRSPTSSSSTACCRACRSSSCFDARTLKPGDVLAAGGSTTYGRDGDAGRPARDRAVRRRREPVEGLHRAARRGSGASLPPTTFIADAHAAGLDVVPYTFRNENQFLPAELRSEHRPERTTATRSPSTSSSSRSASTGVFSDNPDTAKAARDDE